MNKLAKGLLATILGFSIVGARLQDTYLLYAMLGLVCLFVALVAFDKIDKKYYPYGLFIIGLSLLYQTTLMSNGLVGTDIHSEYYYYWLSLNNGWDASIAHCYNSCIGSVLIAPAITKSFGIDGIWIFKVIYPFLFAFVAPLLFLIFKKQFGDKIAFLSVFFFISIPVWSLEMIGLTRQMLGELMLILCAYLIIVSNWRLRYRVSLLLVCAVLGMLFHYVMGLTILLYLVINLVVLLFCKRRVFALKWLAVIVAVFILASIGWYACISSGIMMTSLSAVVSSVAGRQVTNVSPVETELITALPSSDNNVKIPSPNKDSIIEQGTPLIQTAFGLDFANASPLGKAFRIFQYITQVLLLVGCIYLVVHRKRYDWEYLGFVLAGVLLLVTGVLVPMSVTIIGTARVYHLALLFISPALVLGGLFIFRNIKVLAVCLIIPYFLFTSGVMFEVFEYDDISKADVPYSIALSHERVDVAAVFTDNDMAVRDWAVLNQCEPLFLDINGELLFLEKIDTDKWHHVSITNLKELDHGLSLFPQDAEDLPDKCFIFLREWSTQKGLVTFKPGWYDPKGEKSGMRVSHTFSELGLDKIIAASTIVYREGDAVIYEVNK